MNRRRHIPDEARKETRAIYALAIIVALVVIAVAYWSWPVMQ
jgi:hypothetical protein